MFQLFLLLPFKYKNRREKKDHISVLPLFALFFSPFTMDSQPFPKSNGTDGTDGTRPNGSTGRGIAHILRMLLPRREFEAIFGKSTHPKLGLTPREMVERASNAINQENPEVQALLSEVENLAELERRAALKQSLGPVAYWTLKRFIEEADQVLDTLTHEDLLPYAAEFPLPHLVFQLLSRRELPRGVWVEWPGGPGKNPHRLEGNHTAPRHMAPEVFFGLWIIASVQPNELPLGCRLGYWTPINIAWFPPNSPSGFWSGSQLLSHSRRPT